MFVRRYNPQNTSATSATSAFSGFGPGLDFASEIALMAAVGGEEDVPEIVRRAGRAGVEVGQGSGSVVKAHAGDAGGAAQAGGRVVDRRLWIAEIGPVVGRFTVAIHIEAVYEDGLRRARLEGRDAGGAPSAQQHGEQFVAGVEGIFVNVADGGAVGAVKGRGSAVAAGIGTRQACPGSSALPSTMAARV